MRDGAVVERDVMEVRRLHATNFLRRRLFGCCRIVSVLKDLQVGFSLVSNSYRYD